MILPESYSEYKTEHSDYVEDDVEIPPEMDSDKATDFEDETCRQLIIWKIFKNRLAKVCDGFLMAASGYEDIRHELPNLNPTENTQK